MPFIVNVGSIKGISQLVFFSTTSTNAAIFIQKRSQDLTRRYYHYQVVAGTNSFVYDGWNDLIQRTFVGNPNSAADSYGSIQKPSRAYPFEFDPANPATSSPWHNIIYENFNESYFAGFRALNISFPFGEAFTDTPNNHTWLLHPLDQLYGTTGFSTIYSRAGACGMTNGYKSTTLPEWCPARVKGFTGAVKQLLEGTMAPTGRTAMTEYCDVVLYIPGAGGWGGYRDYLHAWWTASAGTNAERDSALTQRLDQMANFIISCKASTDDVGILSVALDIGSLTATPDNVQLYRSLPDYKSDTCELSNWYFAQKLESSGIVTYTESRGQTQTSKIVINATLTGTKGTTSSIAWKNMAMDENFMWFSDPELSLSKGESYFTDNNYINNEAIPIAHRLSGSFLTLGTRLPWNMTTGVTYSGFTMEQYYANFGDSAGPHYTISMVYSPHYAMSQLYAGADVYMDHLYRTRGLQGWADRRKMKTFTTYAIDPYAICGHAVVQPGKTSGSYTWWFAQTINTMPLFYGFGFTTSAATKTSAGYPTTNYTGGFWTDGVNVGNSDTISFFNTNVRGTSFGSQLAVFKKLATTYNPPDVADPPEWLGSGPQPSPYQKYVVDDIYWNGTIDTSLR